MYTYNGVTIPSFQIYERLRQEKRRTKPCPFCLSKQIHPAVFGAMFFMECRGCGATGPCVADYHDPLGLNVTSWIYALKMCHDRWNGWETKKPKIVKKETVQNLSTHMLREDT